MIFHWADGNGGRKQLDLVRFIGAFDYFPSDVPISSLAFVEEKFYLFDGEEWLPFCKCAQGGGSSTEPTNPEPESEVIEPQIFERTIPCTLTINYGTGEPETTWSWHYLSDGETILELPEYITSPDQIKVTGVNGEPIEVVSYDDWDDAWDDSYSLQKAVLFEEYYGKYRLCISESSLNDELKTKLNWNTWQNDGWNVSMTVNITFDLTVKTVIAGYNPDGDGGVYRVCPDVYNEGAYYMSTEGLEATAAGVVVNVQGANYTGTYNFDAKPDLVLLEYYDILGDYGLRDLNIDWSKLSGATEIHIDTAGLAEIIRTQKYSDAENHASSLAVNLPFTNSVTEDTCGNTWTIIHDDQNPTIEDGKLVLYQDCGLSLSGGITLGGQDFTIDGLYIGCQVTTAIQKIFSLQTAADVANDTNSVALMLNHGQMGAYALFAGESLSGNNGATRIHWHHFAIVYQHAQSKATLYIDGLQVATATATLAATMFTKFILGNSPSIDNHGEIGRFSRFRVFNGVAVWTDNFYFDVNTINNPLGGSWRYINAGNADDLLINSTTLTDLPETQSKTGTAFYQTQRVKCFDIPATAEVWIKFDVYFDGTNRWRAYNGGANDTTGITAQTDLGLSYFSNGGSQIYNTLTALKKNTLQTVLLHMITGSSAGVVEAWVDGSLIHTYTGDVNHGEDFADIYLQSDGAGTFFSNVIISNASVGLYETLAH